MPECFIPKPTNLFQEVKNVKFSREDFKLPENKLIFCAIHNPLKINPKLLSSWANILTKIDNSILWVNGINEVYKENFIIKIKLLQRGSLVVRYRFAKLPEFQPERHAYTYQFRLTVQ